MDLWYFTKRWKENSAPKPWRSCLSLLRNILFLWRRVVGCYAPNMAFWVSIAPSKFNKEFRKMVRKQTRERWSWSPWSFSLNLRPLAKLQGTPVPVLIGINMNVRDFLMWLHNLLVQEGIYPIRYFSSSVSWQNWEGHTGMKSGETLSRDLKFPNNGTKFTTWCLFCLLP